MKVLLSIKPKYVQEIMNGTKKFEYRKRIFKKDVESVVIYATMPVGRIIGEFKIETIIKNTPTEVWEQTCSFSGISKDSYLNYFSGYKDAFAIKIKDFVKYKNPINPKELDNNFIAPQSYKYIASESKL